MPWSCMTLITACAAWPAEVALTKLPGLMRCSDVANSKSVFRVHLRYHVISWCYHLIFTSARSIQEPCIRGRILVLSVHQPLTLKHIEAWKSTSLNLDFDHTIYDISLIFFRCFSWVARRCKSLLHGVRIVHISILCRVVMSCVCWKYWTHLVTSCHIFSQWVTVPHSVLLPLMFSGILWLGEKSLQIHDLKADVGFRRFQCVRFQSISVCARKACLSNFKTPQLPSFRCKKLTKRIDVKVTL